jgi:hypothetical protein
MVQVKYAGPEYRHASLPRSLLRRKAGAFTLFSPTTPYLHSAHSQTSNTLHTNNCTTQLRHTTSTHLCHTATTAKMTSFASRFLLMSHYFDSIPTITVDYVLCIILVRHVVRMQALKRPRHGPPFSWTRLKRLDWSSAMTSLSGTIFSMVLYSCSQMHEYIHKTGFGESVRCHVALFACKIVILLIAVAMEIRTVRRAYRYWYMVGAMTMVFHQMAHPHTELSKAEAEKMLDDMAIKERKDEAQWNAVDGCEYVEILRVTD